jgi:uncharacterized protein (TIGR02680 family)
MTRFQITRIGLINVFEYGNQTFDFAGGHLLLRGMNGAGKSKALECTLPFALDGDTSSERLDPFGGRSRPMKWNLLMDGRHEARQGYVWLEFHRPDTRDWVTLAVGLRAVREHDRTDTWFAVIRGARIGVDAHLINPATQAPHGKRQLREKLGGDCAEVFDNARDYRARVNELLFGFQTVERYETMLALQRQLRRPHLSRDLEPRQLSDILSQSLPEIDHDLVGDLGRKLDAIEQLRSELAALRGVHADFAAFVATYRDYARAVTLTRLNDVGERHRAVVTARRALTEQREQLVAATAELTGIGERITAATTTQARLRGEQAELLASPAMRAAHQLRTLADTAAAAWRTHTQITGRLADVASDLNGARAEHERAVAEHRAALERTRDAYAELDAHAGLARLDVHAALADQHAAAEEPAAAERAMREHARQRRGEIGAQRRLRENAERAAALARLRTAEAEKAEMAVSGLSGHKAAAESALHEQRDALSASVGVWLEGLRELPVPAELADALADRVAGLGDEPGALAGLLAAAHRDAADRLSERKAQAGLERDQLTAEQQRLTAERQRWLDEADPEPEPPAARTADRAGRPGAPLWRLLDFDEYLDDAQRAGLEGALQASGLLDAWVTPDGELLDVDGDAFALPARGTGGLERWLRPAAGGPIRAAMTARVLAAIRGVERDAGHHVSSACVALDGSFRLGPLAGRHAKPSAQYIGAAARAADRARRIARLTAELTELAGRLRAAEERIAELAGRSTRLDSELAALPADDAVRSAFRATAELIRQLNAARETARGARDDADRAESDAQAAAHDCRTHAHQHRLPGPGQPPELDVIEDAVADYLAALPELAGAHRAARTELARTERAAETLTRLSTRERELTDDDADAQRRLGEAEGALEAARERDGGDAARTVKRLDELKADLESAESELEALDQRRVDANRNEARLASTLEGVESAVTVAETQERDALDAFIALGPRDLLALALAEHAPAASELERWDAARVNALARAHRDALRTQAGVDTLTNRVDSDFMNLRGRLDGSVGVQAVKVLDRGLILVSALRAGGEEPVRVVLDALAEEIEAHENLLSEEEERTFEEFLFNGLAGHLRERIDNARRLVADTNDAIAGCRTSSGISVELVWDAIADGDPLLARALKLLRTSPQALSDTERAQLVSFFRDRVEAGRVATADGTVTDHLIDALDYRRWHAFKVMQTRDGKRELLTRARHQAGSGGEKSTALHLPLFAAASALMASAQPHAPRMIMLDEAFAGIDGTMRRQLLGLICQFDLDFMMTSHELWCCEPELDRLSIYHLHRQAGLPGVGAVQFLWDGHTKREVAEAA